MAILDPWRFVPLVGTLLFLVLGVGVRELVQRRRYGASGVVLHRAPSWFASLFAGSGLLVPVLMLLQAWVAATSPDTVARMRVVPDAWMAVLRVLGAGLLVGGTVIMFIVQLNLGASWRIGIEAESDAALVTHGFYRWARNPIYSMMFVVVTGYALLMPTWPVLGLALVVIVGFRIWVAGVEEADLLQRYGEVYREYGRRTGRFFPWLGRFR